MVLFFSWVGKLWYTFVCLVDDFVADSIPLGFLRHQINQITTWARCFFCFLQPPNFCKSKLEVVRYILTHVGSHQFVDDMPFIKYMCLLRSSMSDRYLLHLKHWFLSHESAIDLGVYPNYCYPKFTINVHQPCTCSSGIPTALCVYFNRNGRSPIPNHLGCIKKPVNNGINYQPQLVIAGFLNHQRINSILGGGFKCFLCSPRKLGKVPILTHMFSKGLKPPTSMEFPPFTFHPLYEHCRWKAQAMASWQTSFVGSVGPFCGPLSVGLLGMWESQKKTPPVVLLFFWVKGNQQKLVWNPNRLDMLVESGEETFERLK